MIFRFSMVLVIVASASAAGPEPFEPHAPLIARWTFDEPAGNICRDISGGGCDAVLGQAAGVERTSGVFGGGLNFSGSHLLRCGAKPLFENVPAISFSAWVQPSAFDRYNEIFRKEDGERRVLFSFQENGHILSLGLNIGGYVECDAKLDPAQVLDGAWHHAAATFDGKVMRVYLDGAQIGSLERPGIITAGGGAHACIASMDGGECFRGAMDELRIYSAALSADDVARLCRNGIDAIARADAPTQASLDSFFVAEKTFAATLASSRRNVVEKGIALDAKVARIFLARLKSDFPDDCQQFRTLIGADPIAYLRTKGNDFHLSACERLMGLLTEFKPLTKAQQAKQSPDDLRKWNEIAAIEKRLADLKSRGDAAQFSPEWIELMFEAGRRIVWRPYEREAVAPYVAPGTPATRALSAAEARAALESDWLHQAGGKPTADRIRDEIKWARELAARIRGVDFTKELARIGDLEAGLQNPASDLRDVYFNVREIKRAIALKNPVLDFSKLLLVDMPFPQGSEWRHETRHRLGYMAVPGARLLVIDGLRPDGTPLQLMPQAPLHGSFWRPDVSFDGKKVVFCFKPHNEKSFHLYEINADGTGLIQLTDGPFDDLDPVFLPDGHILFSTTRGHSYVRCMPPTSAFVLARCDSDGHNIYLISANNEPDYLPSVMNDGRVIYTRWEYTDKPVWRMQKLWTINPDGTYVSMFWGNQSVWPDVVKDARAIPGSRRVMMTGCGHHDWFAGSIGIIDLDKGLNFPNGIAKVTADVPWPEVGNGPVDPVESQHYHASGHFPAYYSPYPLSEKDFLVSAARDGKFRLYLMDTDGNRELVYEGIHNIFHAIPLRPRALPPVVADRVAWPRSDDREQPQSGVVFSDNVYEGVPAELRGMVKFLRVFTIDAKTYTYWNKRPYISTGPVVSGVQSEGVKRLLGTAPVEADGSVSFRAPAGIPLHFQLLDENQRALQTMRSFVNVMPGESRGCLGCHELHSRAPAVIGGSIAMRKTPREITPPPWPDTTISFARYVRPALDKYCVRCHGGAGREQAPPDLTSRPGFLDFDETYWNLIGRPTWGKPYQAPANPPPGFGIAGVFMVEGYATTDPKAYATPAAMTSLSRNSRLISLASTGRHHDVRVDDISLQRLVAWIDAMCPYRGDEEVRSEPDPVFQGVDWLAIRPKIKTAPRIARPGPVD